MSHCYNLTNDDELRNFVKKVQAEFDSKFPNGDLGKKRKFLQDAFDKQEKQSIINLTSNSNAVQSLLDRLDAQQKDFVNQGFKKIPKNQLLQEYFLGSGKWYNKALQTFERQVAAEKNARAGAYLADIKEGLLKSLEKNEAEKTINKLFENFDLKNPEDRALNNDIRRELLRLNPKDTDNIQPTNNRVAEIIATVINKHNKTGLQDMASLEIPYAKRLLENNRKGYDGLQTHDIKKLIPENSLDPEADFLNWKEQVQNLLVEPQARLFKEGDTAKMIWGKLTGSKMNESQLKASAQRNYDIIKSFDDDSSTALDFERGLYFKDIEASLKYDELYGKDVGIIKGTQLQLQNFGAQIVSTKELGLNPYAVLNAVYAKISQEQGFTRKQSAKIKAEAFENFYDNVMNNNANLAKDTKFNEYNAKYRKWVSMARYGSTALNQAGLDASMGSFQNALRNGKGELLRSFITAPYTWAKGTAKIWGGIGKEFKELTGGQKVKGGLALEERIELERNGIAVFLGQQHLSKFFDETQVLGQKAFNRLSLLEHAQNYSQRATAEMLATDLARDLTQNFSDISSFRKAYYNRAGITEAEFNILKELEPNQLNLPSKTKININTLYPSDVKKLDTSLFKDVAKDKIGFIEKKKQSELESLKNDFKNKELAQLQEENANLLFPDEIKATKISKDYTLLENKINEKYQKEINNVLRIAKMDLENKLASAQNDAFLRTQGLKRLSNKINSATGEATSELTKYFYALKTPIMNNYQDVIQTILFHPELDKFGKGGIYVGFAGASIVTAMLSLWQLDLLNGREPQEFNKEFLVRATTYSNINNIALEGLNTIFGASIGTSRNPEMSLATDMLNFLGADLGQLYKVASGSVQLVNKGKVDPLVQSLRGYMPFANLWATRQFTEITFDYLSVVLGGNAIGNKQKSLSRQKNVFGNQRSAIFRSDLNN